jgi:hypothetical protein
MMAHHDRSRVSLEIETLRPFVEFDLFDELGAAESMRHCISWTMIEQSHSPAESIRKFEERFGIWACTAYE